MGTLGKQQRRWSIKTPWQSSLRAARSIELQSGSRDRDHRKPVPQDAPVPQQRRTGTSGSNFSARTSGLPKRISSTSASFMERLDVDPGALTLLGRFAAALDLEPADHGGRLPRVPVQIKWSTGRLHFGGRAAPANDKTDLHGRRGGPTGPAKALDYAKLRCLHAACGPTVLIVLPPLETDEQWDAIVLDETVMRPEQWTSGHGSVSPARRWPVS
jgi:hypothetical protein